MRTANLHALAKGQRHTVTISSLAPGGEGLSKELGPPVFVSRGVPGDLVEIELFDVRKDFAKGKIIQVLTASEHRVEPPCPLFKVCGGCQWQHISYDYQLQAKQNIVKQSIQHIGGLSEDLVRPTIGAPEPLFYRNKAQFPVKHPHGSTRILAGYYKQDSHELVNIKHCPVQTQSMDAILEAAKLTCERHGLTAYDEHTHTGILRHINIRFSFESKKALLTLVLNLEAASLDQCRLLPRFSRVQNAADELLEGEPALAGVAINLNSKRGNRILGEQTFSIAGADRIQEVLRTARPDRPAVLQNGLKFDLSPSSFFQINTAQTVTLLEQVYDQLVQASGAGKIQTVIDAYAGVGAISMWLASLADKVIAVEDHSAAVADGIENARLNGITNVEFKEGKVESVLPALSADGIKIDVIVVDPPRKGMSPEAVEAILAAQPEAIIYVSCNPSTLARDLKMLGAPRNLSTESGENEQHSGYKTMQIQPVDLFPQTFHVESVTKLERFVAHGSVGNLEEA